MNTPIDFAMPRRALIGSRSIRQLPGLLKEEGLKRAVVLMDAGIEKSGIGATVTKLLTDNGLSVDTISNLPREPGVPDVDAVLASVRAFQPDTVVAIGGGSVLDVGKLCAVLTKSPGSVLDLLDGDEMPAHSVHTTLIPTTAGTGSEATKNAIIAIPSRNSKGAVVHHRLLPDLVILDPELTTTLPPGLTATTGIDALCHAMECYLSNKANVVSDLLAVEAMTRIARSIRTAVTDGMDIEARNDMLLASYLAGQCITLAGTNAVHAMSYPLGVRYHVPHGESNAVLLPHVMKHNAQALPRKTLQVARCFGFDQNATDRSAPEYLVSELHQLNADLGITRTLTDFGAVADDIPVLVESAHTNRRLMDNNPVDLAPNQIEQIYRDLMETPR